VDFLKCDIEGGEFTLFGADSRLLKMTSALAIEVHSFAGDVERFAEKVRAAGFSIHHRTDAIDGSCVLLASRPLSDRTESFDRSEFAQTKDG
jgi:hypothetical protein